MHAGPFIASSWYRRGGYRCQAPENPPDETFPMRFLFQRKALACPLLFQRGQTVRHRRFEQDRKAVRSEEHTSELQSLMRSSYAVFCLKKKKTMIIKL